MCAPRRSSISTTLLSISVCIVGRSPSSVPSVLSASHTLGPTASTWTTATHIASHTENSCASQALVSEEQALSSTGKWFCVICVTTRRNIYCTRFEAVTVVLRIQAFQNVTRCQWVNSAWCSEGSRCHDIPENLNLECIVIQKEANSFTCLWQSNQWGYNDVICINCWENFQNLFIINMAKLFCFNSWYICQCWLTDCIIENMKLLTLCLNYSVYVLLCLNTMNIMGSTFCSIEGASPLKVDQMYCGSCVVIRVRTRLQNLQVEIPLFLSRNWA